MSATFDIKQALCAVLAIAVLSVVCVLPAQALAAGECESAGSDPTAAQYCTEEPPPEEPPEVHSETATSVSPPPVVTVAPEGSNEVAGVSEESGSLPFTGADLLALAAVACAFICIGLALRRLSTAKPDSR